MKIKDFFLFHFLWKHAAASGNILNKYIFTPNEWLKIILENVLYVIKKKNWTKVFKEI